MSEEVTEFNNPQVHELDPHFESDHDDADCESFATDTTSLSESVFDFEFVGDRSYHSSRFQSRYYLPNDTIEQDRMDMMHNLWRLHLNDRLHLAQVPGRAKILDVGTGTGIWAIEMGDEYPNASVEGVDLSPIQPLWVPPNVKFLIEDIQMPWIHRELDLVHVRNMYAAISDWRFVINQAYKSLVTGGHIEIKEIDVSTQYASRLGDWTKKYHEKFHEAISTRQLLITKEEILQYLLDAGFGVIIDMDTTHPLGAWGADRSLRKQGSFLVEVGKSGFESYALVLFTEVLKMSEDETKKLCTEAKKESLDITRCAYYKGFVIVARK